MNTLRIKFLVISLFLYISVGVPQTQAAKSNYKPPKQQTLMCSRRGSKCFLKRVTCPVECPRVRPTGPKAKACFLDCLSPKCEAVCRNRKPNCNGPGAACYDPRFIGGDGIVFYFHGSRNEHFSLISDTNLQINARFIGLRPAGRTRDYTWIQALGLMFGSNNLTLEASKTEKWENEVDHLQFSYNGKIIVIPENESSEWISPDKILKLERISSKNSVIATVSDVVEVSVNVIPVTEKDSIIHNYQIPSNDSFAHLEVQFRFFGLSPKVEGVLGKTYRPDFENPAKAGVDMAIVGGEDRHRTSSLLSADCGSCAFSPDGNFTGDIAPIMDYSSVDCTGGSGGNGILCRK